ncbi:unnamed protein product [Heterosigma akashiwo]
MKFGYKLNRLMGSVYGHGLSTEESCAPNVVFTPDGNSILSPIGNRINVVDLVNTSVRTLTPQSRKNIRLLALSHSGKLLLSIDEDGRGLFINMTKGLPVHRVRFKGKVRAAAFSPDDRWFALAVGQKLQIWRTPGLVQEFAPLALEKQLAGGADDLTCLAWAPDSDHILVGSRDLSARLLRRAPPAGAGWQAVALSGHRGPLVSVAFLAGAAPPPPPAAAAAAAAPPPPRRCARWRRRALFLWRCDDPRRGGREEGEEGRRAEAAAAAGARAGGGGGRGRPGLAAGAEGVPQALAGVLREGEELRLPRAHGAAGGWVFHGGLRAVEAAGGGAGARAERGPRPAAGRGRGPRRRLARPRRLARRPAPGVGVAGGGLRAEAAGARARPALRGLRPGRPPPGHRRRGWQGKTLVCPDWLLFRHL